MAMASAILPEAVWSERTTPDAIEAALRGLLAQRSRLNQDAESGGLVPARVLNMVVFVESAQRGDRQTACAAWGAITPRARSCSPTSASARSWTRVCASPQSGDRGPGEPALLRETAIVQIGERHLDDLTTIADPLVISDLPTLLWSPHRHPAAADALLELAQATLIDSIEEPVWSAAIERACGLSEQAYVVDLAWLRSTPWRERVAATFDPERMRRRAGLARAPGDPPPPGLDGGGDAVRRLAGLAAGLAAGPLADRRARRGVDGAAAAARERRRARCRAAPAGRAGAAGARPRGGGAVQRVGASDRARSGTGRSARAPPRARRHRARVDAAGRLARRGRHPRRGHPSGAAARPDLPAGAARRPGDAARAGRRSGSMDSACTMPWTAV